VNIAKIVRIVIENHDLVKIMITSHRDKKKLRKISMDLHEDHQLSITLSTLPSFEWAGSTYTKRHFLN